MAPLDVRAEIERFDASLPIEAAWTPPASWYVEPEVLALEAATVFARSWLLAARADQVAAAGAFATARCADRDTVVVRGADDELRAFDNVCRHHAALVMEGEGHCDQLRCPYHGWTYDLTGRLTSAPRSGGIEGFDRGDFSLHELQVEEWGPLVFTRAAPGGDAFGDTTGDLRAHLDLAGLRFVTRRDYTVRCNWKVFVDNYLDGGYHVSVAHPGLADQLDLASYRTDVFDRHSVQSCNAAKEAVAGADFPDRMGERGLYAWVYPNLMLNRYGPILDTNLVLPISATETRVVFDYYFDAAHAADTDFVTRSLAASDRVQQEDIALCESVQRGLASPGYDRGRYAPKIEIAEHHFHRLLAADLRESCEYGV